MKPTDSDNDGFTDAPTAPVLPKQAAVAAPLVSDQIIVQSPDVAPADDVVVRPLRLDTPQSDAAIDDIVAQEADEVLAAQDAGIEAAIEAANDAAEAPAKHGHPIFWFMVILMVVIIGVVVVILTSPGLSPSFAP